MKYIIYLIKKLTILYCILIMQGCTSSLILGSTIIATQSIQDSRSIGTQIDDKILEICILYALFKDKKIKQQTRITSTVYKGNVLLTGQAPNKKLAEKAVKISNKIKGTKQIYNEIRQCNPLKLSKILEDMWITTKIKSQLIIQNQLITPNIKVITENKEVFLIGKITHQEENKIINTISNIKKIKHIIIALDYT